MNFKSVWAATLLFLIWLGGLIWFVYDIPVDAARAATKTDAIVVLTGGNNRIAAAFELLDQELAGHLFISGVNPGASLKEIKASSGFHGKVASSKITLDEQSTSTKENALYTAKWLKDNHCHSIRLVTANYHMRRSLLEFHQAMPDILIIPHPTATHERLHPAWIYLYEYHKYLGALLRWKVKTILHNLR